MLKGTAFGGVGGGASSDLNHEKLKKGTNLVKKKKHCELLVFVQPV